MATSKCNTRLNIRSNSLPSRSYPSALRLEKQLNKLKTWEEASSMEMADMICSSLLATEELYRCLDDLLELPLTQQAPSLHLHEEWANELLDGSVRFLDICSAAREFMSQLREHASDLQSSLRRRKGDSTMESSIKESKRLLAALKQMNNKIGASSLINQDHRLQTMISVLKEVSTGTISIFRSLFLFLSVPIPKTKPARWSMVSKLMHKGAVTCKEEQENANELESVDAALWSLCRYGSNEGQKMQIAQNRLEALEADIQAFENALGCMFRRLIKARASLLNHFAWVVWWRSRKFWVKQNISLPRTLRIEEEMKKLKAWEEDSSVPTVDTICNVSGVEELYKYMDDMLGLPLAQLNPPTINARNGQMNFWMVRLLDICGTASDSMSQLKEHSLLRFFSLPVSKAKPAKWSMVSKLMHKGALTWKERQNYVHEFESADAALCSLCTYGSSEVEKMQIAQSKLEVLEAGIDGFENHLRSIFRRLVKARASLLNVISN
ncbi:LOW QUALITY PROTEIN: hypothetical protein RJ639_039709 [Escallonia herrerae]|uniref:Uncharacterized protein n=1 Tax=Escallonia herrerae TaxID=1293975 RepID=A0AA88WLQ5_9ASTE|nr:LOW QUALITY PROTEIN: hypothetical protein RJ639_039709 [Escallonia herrerae]